MVRASTPQDDSISAVLGRKLDRRVVLKAAAALSAIPLASERALEAGAQDSAEVRAATWHADVDDRYSSDAGYTTFLADFPFNAIAPHWAGGDDGITIEIQLSSDGDFWTDPAYVGPSHADGGPPDRAGRQFGSLTFVAGAQFVRFRALDAGGDPTDVSELAFTYIDASNGPSLEDALALIGFGIGGARPPIISRATWGANESYRFDSDGNVLWPQEYEPVQHVIIHHTETPNAADPLQAMRSIYYYHAVERGWGDIGYNYLVDHLGNIYEGRAGGENVVGGHAYQYSYGSSGIGTIGDFSYESATVEAQAALVAITAWTGRGLDPYGRRDFHDSPGVPTICGHRDVVDSLCPGDALYAHLPAIRDLVAEVQRVASTTPGGPLGPGQVVRVLIPDGNLRSGPSTSRRIVRTLPVGTVMTIIDGPASNDGFLWYKVADTDGAGWSALFLFEPQPADALPMESAFEPGDAVLVATDALNLRASPGTRSSIRATLSTGATATVQAGPKAAEGFQWYELRTQSGTGWAVGMFLARDTSSRSGGGSFAAGDRVQVSTDKLNVRSRAGLGARVITVLPTGATAAVLAGPKTADGYDWYQLQTPDGNGWAVAQYLTRANGAGANPEAFWIGDDVAVATDVLNLRARPSTTGSVLAAMPTGTRLSVTAAPVTADGHVWCEVASDDYGRGWCVATYLERVPFAEGQRVRVIDGTLNLRSDPGTSSPVLAVLPDRARLTVLSGPTNSSGQAWYRVRSGDYGTGWAAGRYLQKA